MYILTDTYTALARSLTVRWREVRCEVWGSPYQFIEKKAYFKNSAKSFWLPLNSKVLALVAKFSALVHAALLLPNFRRKWLNKFSVFQTMPPTLYDLWYSTWTRLGNIINRFYGVVQKCVFSSFHELCITLFGNGITA